MRLCATTVPSSLRTSQSPTQKSNCRCSAEVQPARAAGAGGSEDHASPAMRARADRAAVGRRIDRVGALLLAFTPRVSDAETSKIEPLLSKLGKPPRRA